jgi:hypothetical protein
MRFDRIISNVPALILESIRIEYSNFRKALLLERGLYPEFFPGAKRKSALYHLDSLLNRHLRIDRDEDVKVIRHDNEFVQPIFSLGSIVIQVSDEKLCGTRGLKKISFAQGRGGDEESAFAGGDSGGIGVTARDGHASIIADALAFCGDKHHAESVEARAEIESAAKAGFLKSVLRHACRRALIRATARWSLMADGGWLVAES